MTRPRIAGSLLAGATVLAALMGCGGDDDSASADAADPGPTADPIAERLAGRYAHYDVVAYESTDMKTLIISYGFTDLAVDGDDLVATESFCHAEHETDQPITVTISDEATRAIVPDSVAVELGTEDGRAILHRPETPTPLGIELSDPANDPLPDDPDDPRIRDDDGDGRPGVTVEIEVSADLRGELYIARREIFSYDVVEQDDGSLTGTVRDRSEQLLLGATDDIFLTAAEWVQVPDLERSPIILEPVEGDWDCDRLMAERDDLFPPNPTVDW